MLTLTGWFVILKYGKVEDTSDVFEKLKIASEPSFRKHLNQYNVIFLNIQNFLSLTHNIQQMIEKIENALCRELLEDYENQKESEEISLTERPQLCSAYLYDRYFAD